MEAQQNPECLEILQDKATQFLHYINDKEGKERECAAAAVHGHLYLL